MTIIAGAPVVAGIDGSEHQPAVLAWAVAEARMRHRPLSLAHGFVGTVGTSFDTAPYGAVQEAIHDNAQRVRDEALDMVTAMAPDVRVTASVLDGTPAGVLVRASENAAAVVVGRRGRGGFPGLLIGSVAAKVAAHATCPVVVVRPASGAGPHAGRVVAGVDGSPHSAALLEFAFDEASLRGVGLSAAWLTAVEHGAEVTPITSAVEVGATREVLRRILAGLGQPYAAMRIGVPDPDHAGPPHTGRPPTGDVIDR